MMVHFTYSSSSCLFLYFVYTIARQKQHQCQAIFVILLYAVQSDILYFCFFSILSLIFIFISRNKEFFHFRFRPREEKFSFSVIDFCFFILCDLLDSLSVRSFFVCVYFIGRVVKQKSDVANYKNQDQLMVR